MKNKAKPFGIKKLNDVALLELQVPDKPVESGWEQWILMTSDWHWDNDHCDLSRLEQDLELAVERDAPIMAFGDLFCLMQGRYDPRRSRHGMRKSLDKDNYLDEVVNQAAEWMQPYAKNFVLATRGNHEISNMRNNETDVIERWCERIRMDGAQCLTGGIGGWVFVRAWINGKSKTYRIAYHHGAGGGGFSTKGVIKASRRSVYLPQADLVVSGHIHERWAVTNMQEAISLQGKRSLRQQVHVTLPTYKQEYHPDHYDYHVLNERPPKPLGGCWLRLSIDGRTGEFKSETVFT